MPGRRAIQWQVSIPGRPRSRFEFRQPFAGCPFIVSGRNGRHLHHDFVAARDEHLRDLGQVLAKPAVSPRIDVRAFFWGFLGGGKTSVRIPVEQNGQRRTSNTRGGNKS